MGWLNRLKPRKAFRQQDQQQDHCKTVLRAGILEALQSMDINWHKGSPDAAGWSHAGSGVVIIPIANLIAALAKVLPSDADLQQAVDSKQLDHPATSRITEELGAMQLLHTPAGYPPSADRLFAARVGMIKFQACVLLDKEALAELLPSVVSMWGDCGYPVKVLGETPKCTEALSRAV